MSFESVVGNSHPGYGKRETEADVKSLFKRDLIDKEDRDYRLKLARGCPPVQKIVKEVERGNMEPWRGQYYKGCMAVADFEEHLRGGREFPIYVLEKHHIETRKVKADYAKSIVHLLSQDFVRQLKSKKEIRPLKGENSEEWFDLSKPAAVAFVLEDQDSIEKNYLFFYVSTPILKRMMMDSSPMQGVFNPCCNIFRRKLSDDDMREHQVVMSDLIGEVMKHITVAKDNNLRRCYACGAKNTEECPVGLIIDWSASPQWKAYTDPRKRIPLIQMPMNIFCCSMKDCGDYVYSMFDAVKSERNYTEDISKKCGNDFCMHVVPDKRAKGMPTIPSCRYGTGAKFCLTARCDHEQYEYIDAFLGNHVLEEKPGESWVVKVADLNPNLGKDWSAKVLVTDKSAIKSWQNSTRRGKILTVEVTDDSGGTIRVVFFNDMAELKEREVRLHKRYTIGDGKIRPKDARYSSGTTSPYEIVMNDDSYFYRI